MGLLQPALLKLLRKQQQVRPHLKIRCVRGGGAVLGSQDAWCSRGDGSGSSVFLVQELLFFVLGRVWDLRASFACIYVKKVSGILRVCIVLGLCRLDLMPCCEQRSLSGFVSMLRCTALFGLTVIHQHVHLSRLHAWSVFV